MFIPSQKMVHDELDFEMLMTFLVHNNINIQKFDIIDQNNFDTS